MKYWARSILLVFFVIMMANFIWSPAKALAESAIGTLGSVIGKASIRRNGASVPVKKGMEIFASDELQTERRTAVKIIFTDGGNFMAFEDSKVKISEYKFKSLGDKSSLKSVFDVAKGKVRFFVKPESGRTNETSFKTSNAVMGIRGTSGFIDASDPSNTKLVVLTGKVEVSNPKFPGQSVMVPPNQMTTVELEKAPTPPKVAPPALVSGLNAQAEKLDPNVGKGEKQAHDNKENSDKKESEAGKADKKELKDEPKPSDKKEGLDKEGLDKSVPESGSTNVNPESSSAAKSSSPSTSDAETAKKVTNEETKPVIMEKKTVFSPDGKNTLSVKNEALNGMVSSSNSGNSFGSGAITAEQKQKEAVASQNLSNVNLAKQVNNVLKENTDKLEETKAVQAAAEAPKVAAGAGVKVKIKINLPPAP